MNQLYNKIKDNVSPTKSKKLKNMIDELQNYNFSRKIYHSDFNEISYNHKKIVQDTISKQINKCKIDDNNSSDINIDSDSDTDSSKDSFYYVTESDSDTD